MSTPAKTRIRSTTIENGIGYNTADKINHEGEYGIDHDSADLTNHHLQSIMMGPIMVGDAIDQIDHWDVDGLIMDHDMDMDGANGINHEGEYGIDQMARA